MSSIFSAARFLLGCLFTLLHRATTSNVSSIQCIVQPSSGYVFETTFLFGCTPAKPFPERVQLRVYIRDSESDRLAWYRGRLIHVLPDLGIYQIKLPLGDESQGYQARLRVEAVDKGGRASELKVEPVKVGPPRKCQPLEGFSRSVFPAAPGEVHSTLALAVVVGSYAEACDAAKDAIALLPLVERIKPRSVTQLEHASEALRAVGFAIVQLPPSRQMALAQVASRWTQLLRRREPQRLIPGPGAPGTSAASSDVNNAPSDEARLVSAVALLRAVVRLHRGAVEGAACRHAVSRALVGTLDAISRAVAPALSTGSISLRLAGGYGLCLANEQAAPAATLGWREASSVTLAPASPARCLVLDANPFPCAGDTVLNTQFVMVKASTVNASVELYLKKRKAEGWQASFAHAIRGFVTLHRVRMPTQGDFEVLVEIKPEMSLDFLKVVFTSDREPTELDLQVPPPTWVANRTLVPWVPRNGSDLYIGVTLKLEGVVQKRAWPPPRIPYRLGTALVTCRTWKHYAWSRQGCRAGLATSSLRLHCRCSHLSWFSGGHWVAPNEISWRKVTRGARDKSFLVVSCVVALWVLYGLVLVWARRADQRDEVYNTVMDLHQNLPTDQQPYIVTIITGFRRNAGTTSKVWLQLVGLDGSSRKFLLKDVSVNPSTLQRKSEDYFLATTERTLGEIREVVFTLEPKGSRPSWFLHTVVVQDMLEDLVWVFFVEEWLVPSGCHQESFRFSPANGEQQADFWTLFRRRLQRHFFTGHTWFNVIARYRSSKFTRAQRVTSALFVILSALMFNVMYYDVDTTSDSEHMSLFDVPVHLNDFLLGIQVSLVTVPLGVFVIFVFSNCRPRPMSQQQSAENDPRTRHHHRISLFSYMDNLSQNCSESSTEHRTQLLQEYARILREGRKGLLPWWFQLVGWVVALAGSMLCSAVILLYGFSYGNKKSKELLVRSLTGLVHNEIILEPLKVVLISAFLARLIPRPPEVDDYSIRNTLTDLPEDLRP
ncbi:polycystin-1-like protein 2 isoform X1 [Ornithodoros turicata]|uniref:polycystin-1-like protein 2 isoform X1 n=1 Tax=Ornithodoros turicata TaxID=34597 RepID=UPI003139A660